jgi:hypothetical protein
MGSFIEHGAILTDERALLANAVGLLLIHTI